MAKGDFSVIYTADPQMRKVLQLAENVAASKASILISGESGTGKELLARFIHGKSNRSNKGFFAINCAALPDGLLESELFGYEKGAFTGADQRKPGLFEVAKGGTFLLDEISEMPILLQAKLLRVLQEGELQRLGGHSTVPIDVRIIATTNRDLNEQVKMGSFREDLFYGLNVIPLEIPALRERPKDIQLLARTFTELACTSNGHTNKELTESALKKLTSYGWPGNVRELQNIIERAVLISTGEKIQGEEIQVDTNIKRPSGGIAAGMTVSEAERLLILKTLEYTGQNRTQAARLLGISIRTLRNKINEYKQVSAL